MAVALFSRIYALAALQMSPGTVLLATSMHVTRGQSRFFFGTLLTALPLRCRDMYKIFTPNLQLPVLVLVLVVLSI
jgi:hypothetical protein